jgi:Patatin-like phospholipase
MIYEPGTRFVNGVFKGGGAKGTAYAGALEAIKAHKVWFKSVAGASAGAITAALVASGMDPDEVKEAVPSGLKVAGAGKAKRAINAIFGEERSIFAGDGLRTWLDGLMRQKIGKQAAGPVTFAELFAATGIELYVVVMDLANGQPVVFCRRTTPGVEVAGAVVSSSAIPGAFPAGRGVFEASDNGTVIHQFVDGGSWANYPSFVFEDWSFRTWLHHQAEQSRTWDEAAWDEENKRPVVGFILGDPPTLEHRHPTGMVPLGRPRISPRFDQGPSYTATQPASYLFGSLLSSNGSRALISAAMAIWVTMSVITMPIALRRFAAWLHGVVPGPAYPIVLVVSLTVVLFAAVISIVVPLLLVAAGRLIADTVLPTVKAIMAVPTDVAPWVGIGNRSVVLRVPHGNIGTTQFDISDAVRDAAVTNANTEVTTQLEDPVMKARLEALLSGVTPAEAVPANVIAAVSLPNLAAPSRDRVSIVGFVVAAAMALLAGTLGWWVTNAVGTDALGRIVLFLVIGFVGVGAAVLYVSGHTERRAAGRAQLGITPAGVHGIKTAAVALALGVASLAGGYALSMSAMDHRSLTTTVGKVSTAMVKDGQNNYTIVVDGVAVAVTDSRHLRLGERVFVKTDSAGTSRLAGPIEGGRFGLSLGLSMLGIGLITSGLRRRSWVKRCKHLAAVAAGWAS